MHVLFLCVLFRFSPSNRITMLLWLVLRYTRLIELAKRCRQQLAEAEQGGLDDCLEKQEPGVLDKLRAIENTKELEPCRQDHPDVGIVPAYTTPEDQESFNFSRLEP